jgi:hypothetical protein
VCSVIELDLTRGSVWRIPWNVDNSLKPDVRAEASTPSGQHKVSK